MVLSLLLSGLGGAYGLERDKGNERSPQPKAFPLQAHLKVGMRYVHVLCLQLIASKSALCPLSLFVVKRCVH